jgi:hypothetical protein
MNNNTRVKKEFWRYGPEIIDHDVIVLSGCRWTDCTLCGPERKEKCDKIKEIISKQKKENYGTGN